MSWSNDGKCHCCRRTKCCCGAEEAETKEPETKEPETKEPETKEPETEEGVFYRVRPYAWSMRDQKGTCYQIEQVKMLATSRREEDAKHIVNRLNAQRRTVDANRSLRHANEVLAEEVERLARKAERLKNQIRYPQEKWKHTTGDVEMAIRLATGSNKSSMGFVHLGRFVRSFKRARDFSRGVERDE